ncbi:gas vesicle protein [Evansella vedderi]|uniref:Gas vesicle protein n=1 Tax=Evansella vedderi TaxID=38282 RepID=A0ABT9ZSL7_9BACI|nr:hypothetical protein [Evansella vedderi]MDQ0254219.1 gas vesicle protein [Evansella vedderi]
MAKSSTYLCGVLIGGTIAGTAVLLSSPNSSQRFREEISLCKDVMIDNFQGLKRDLQELVYIGEELKEKALSFINDKLPDLVSRIKQFSEEIQPHLYEMKGYLLYLQQIVIDLKNRIQNWDK